MICKFCQINDFIHLEVVVFHFVVGFVMLVEPRHTFIQGAIELGKFGLLSWAILLDRVEELSKETKWLVRVLCVIKYQPTRLIPFVELAVARKSFSLVTLKPMSLIFSGVSGRSSSLPI